MKKAILLLGSAILGGFAMAVINPFLEGFFETDFKQTDRMALLIRDSCNSLWGAIVCGIWLLYPQKKPSG